MIIENLQAIEESRDALQKVMDNVSNSHLTAQESERNIADNLVVVARFEGAYGTNSNGNVDMRSKGTGTGLMLTTDGFVLTAYHNIQAYVEDWKRINAENPPREKNLIQWLDLMRKKYAVVDQKKNAHPIDTTVLAFNPEADIAIIKAVTRRKPRAVEFRVLEKELSEGDCIRLLALKNQQRYESEGTVIYGCCDVKLEDPRPEDQSGIIRDTVLTSAHGTYGVSGGTFLTPQGEFAGTITYVHTNGDRQLGGNAGGAKVKHIVKLVRELSFGLDRLVYNVIDS